jgi:uncharacterized repeat protein (TIGR02543 family)
MKTRMIGLYGFLAVMLAFTALGSALASCGGTTQPNLPYGGAGTSNNNGGTGTNNTGTGGGTGTNNNYGTGANNPVSYTVQFKVNGGSGSTPSTQTANAGSSITLPNGNALSRPGFAFDGWNTEPDGTGTSYAAGTLYTVTGNVTLYAKWTPVVTYTVSFDTNGGTPVPASQTIADGGKVTEPAVMAKNGYTFGGWYKENTFSTQWNFSSNTVTGNMTLYAKWADTSTVWTVKFETNGGSPVGDAMVLRSTSVNCPMPDPTRTGYIFNRWFVNSGLTTVYNFSSVVIDNITLYAQWNPISYNVTYDKNAADATGSMANSSHTYDVDETLNSNAFTRTGYTFTGWAKTTTGAVEFTNSAAVKNLTSTAGGAVNLYAKWNPISYNVTYNKNAADATGSMANSSHTYDVDKTLNANVFTRTGYTFAGWARTSTGAVEFTNSAAVKNLTATAGGTVNLYAKWLPNTAGITLNVEQITDGTGALTIPAVTISRTNNGYPVTSTVSVTASDYDNGSITWKVAGVGTYADQSVSGNGASFTLNAAEVKYNSIGGHVLTLTVAKGGVQYQRAIPFTIVH